MLFIQVNTLLRYSKFTNLFAIFKTNTLSYTRLYPMFLNQVLMQTSELPMELLKIPPPFVQVSIPISACCDFYCFFMWRLRSALSCRKPSLVIHVSE